MKNWVWASAGIGLLVWSLADDHWQVLGILALAWLGYQWWRQHQQNLPPPPPDCNDLHQQLAEINSMIAQLTDTQTAQSLALQASAIARSLQQTQPRVVIVGRKGVGKTAIVHALTGQVSSALTKVTVLDTHHELGEIDRASADSGEIVVLVVTSDLTASDYQFIQTCPSPLIIALNKSDLLLPSDRAQILERITYRCDGILPPENIVAISAQPRPLTVRQYAQDGSALVHKWQEILPPDIEPLKQRLDDLLRQGWHHLWRQKRQQKLQALHQATTTALNAQRRKLAESAILRQQQLVALTLFASPFPTLDLATSIILNSQLLLEIAKIYEQPLTFDQSKQMATDLARQLVQLGGIELITSTISSFLKTNFLTYTIGASIQALSAAYFTHICAQSFMDYLEHKSTRPSPNILRLVNYSLPQWLREYVPHLLTGLRPVPTTGK